MLKKSGITIALLAFSFTTIKAQDLPEASVEVTTEFVSNYVWRGADLLGPSIAEQKKLNQDGKIQAWAFQPSITFNTPVEGLSFNIWGSFATKNRKDTDSDQRIQQGPSGPVLSDGQNNNLEFNQILDLIRQIDSGAIAGSGTTASLDNMSENGNTYSTSISLHKPGCEDAKTCVPGFYKEPNGTKRLDEIDYTLDYTRETTVGTMSFGIVYYTYPNVVAKDDADQEVYVGYALPDLSELTFTAYTSIESGAASRNYFLLAYENDFEISDGLAFTYGASAGYGIRSYIQGFQDVTGSVGIDYNGFYVTFNVAHRPDTRFVEDDIGDETLETANLAIFGLSSVSDGLMEDKSQTAGLANNIINASIQRAINATVGSPANGYSYTYTPRQKIPKEIYWVSLGYTFSM